MLNHSTNSNSSWNPSLIMRPGIFDIPTVKSCPTICIQSKQCKRCKHFKRVACWTCSICLGRITLFKILIMLIIWPWLTTCLQCERIGPLTCFTGFWLRLYIHVKHFEYLDRPVMFNMIKIAVMLNTFMFKHLKGVCHVHHLVIFKNNIWDVDHVEIYCA